MTDKTTVPDGLTLSEWEGILEQRKQRERNIWRNVGLQDAARLAERWADESCGGSGKGGECYRNLATSIRKLQQ